VFPRPFPSLLCILPLPFPPPAPEFAAYLRGLQQRKPVVLTGDLNVAPAEIDIHNPKGNLKSAGEEHMVGCPLTMASLGQF